eukprot:COSAG06_NODE_454_length_15536_cov_23.174257_9_plen_331_part_00
MEKSFVSNIVIPTPGRYTSDLHIQLSLPLRTQASPEERHTIGLRTLRREMETTMQAQRAELLGVIQEMQAELAAMRREQAGSSQLRKELEVLRRWHVEPLVYGRACLGSRLPCARDHPELAPALKFAALQVAIPQVSDAGIRALWDAGLTAWAELLPVEAAVLAKLLDEADAAALDEMLHPPEVITFAQMSDASMCTLRDGVGGCVVTAQEPGRTIRCVPHDQSGCFGFLLLGPPTAAVSYVEIEADDGYRAIENGYASIQMTVVDGTHKYQDTYYSAEAKVLGDFQRAISGMPQQSFLDSANAKPGDTRGLLINRASGTVTLFENGGPI